MELQTVRFGQLKVSEQEIYTFANGIPGFADQNSFVIVAPEDDHPFAFLQSIKDERLNFVITDPFLFYPDYNFELAESTISELKINSPEQILIRSIISIGGQLDTATINLIAPIVFNLDNFTAKQVVLGRTSYTTKHPLFVEKRR